MFPCKPGGNNEASSSADRAVPGPHLTHNSASWILSMVGVSCHCPGTCVPTQTNHATVSSGLSCIQTRACRDGTAHNAVQIPDRLVVLIAPCLHKLAEPPFLEVIFMAADEQSTFLDKGIWAASEHFPILTCAWGRHKHSGQLLDNIF